MDEQFVLKLPPKLAEKTRQLMRTDALDDKLEIVFDEMNPRKAKVRIAGHNLSGTLVDLPCYIESMRRAGSATFVKCTDISQMLVVSSEETSDMPELIARSEKELYRNGEHLWSSGLTPATKDIRRQRAVRRPPMKREVMQQAEAALLKVMDGTNNLPEIDDDDGESVQISRDVGGKTGIKLKLFHSGKDEPSEAPPPPMPPAKKVRDKKEKASMPPPPPAPSARPTVMPETATITPEPAVAEPAVDGDMDGGGDAVDDDFEDEMWNMLDNSTPKSAGRKEGTPRAADDAEVDSFFANASEEAQQIQADIAEVRSKMQTCEARILEKKETIQRVPNKVLKTRFEKELEEIQQESAQLAEHLQELEGRLKDESG